MNKLVVYFSCTNTTKMVAQKISEVSGSDITEIVPEKPYTSEDLNWNNSSSRTTLEKDNPDLRPKIKEYIDISKYDTIFLGFPIWWYKAPNIIYTFLDNYDFSNKTIIPFCTSGGSTIDSSMDYLIKDYPNIKFIKGRRLSLNDNIKEWVENVIK